LTTAKKTIQEHCKFRTSKTIKINVWQVY
jgi:hypothetical protein